MERNSDHAVSLPPDVKSIAAIGHGIDDSMIGHGPIAAKVLRACRRSIMRSALR